MNIILDDVENLNAKICTIGVGGAGGNAVNNMVNRGVAGVTFITANTDKQALSNTLTSDIILLGEKLTNGLGAGNNPEIGRKAAEETSEKIKEKLTGYDLIFVTCGMGGGTGTGASPVIAKIAKETGALVVAIVSKCFSREGGGKIKLAEEGIAALKENVDAIIVVPNDIISKICSAKNRKEAYAEANNVLYDALNGIVNIIIGDGEKNTDFSDVRKALTNAGEFIIGRGFSTGENAGREAVTNALNSPFLEGLTIKGAKFVLFNIKIGKNYTISHIDEAWDALNEAINCDDGIIKDGESDDESSEDFSVTIIAPAKRIDEIKIKEDKNFTKNEEKIIEKLDSEYPYELSHKNEKLNIKKNANTLFDDGLTNDKPATTKYVAADNKTGIFEVIATTKQTQTGRPHGNEELKKYDTPAILRREESKYNHSININNEIDIEDVNSDTMPADEDMQHIQNIVQNSNVFDTKSVNAFLKQVTIRGL